MELGCRLANFVRFLDDGFLLQMGAIASDQTRLRALIMNECKTRFTCPRAEADVRPGGRILVTMRAPAEWGGFEQHSIWNITELELLRRIRYVFNFADAYGNRITPAEAGIPADGVPADGEHEVLLTDLGDGCTCCT